MSTSNEYWESAALDREMMSYQSAYEYTKRLNKLYEDAILDIKRELKKIKLAYMRRFGIDEQAANAHLARNMRNVSMDITARRLLEAASDEERQAILDFLHRDGLSTRAYAARSQRYRELEDIIELRMIRLAQESRINGDELRGTVYRDNYYAFIDDTAAGLDMGIGFNVIDDRALTEVLAKPWHGKRFSKRVWDNTDRLADEVQEIVARYIVSGVSYKQAEREIADAFGVALYRAETLYRTEAAHARAVSDMRAMQECNMDEYKFLASLDERTCTVCGALDGKVFRLSDAAEGNNYPVMHPRCRCTTVVNMAYKTRSARDMLTYTSGKIDGSITYEQWYSNMSDDERAAFDEARRKNRQAAQRRTERRKKEQEALVKEGI